MTVRANETDQARVDEVFALQGKASEQEEDPIALARRVGIKGVRPAEQPRVDEVFALLGTAREQDDDPIALARRIGISGVRPAGKDQPAAVEPRPRLGLTFSQSSTSDAQPPNGANCNGASIAPSPVAKTTRQYPGFIAVSVVGELGSASLARWDAERGFLGAKVGGAEMRLVSKSEGLLQMLFRAPNASASLRKADGLSLVPGIVLRAIAGANLTDFGFVDARGAAIGSSAMSSVPLLPDSVIKAIPHV